MELIMAEHRKTAHSRKSQRSRAGLRIRESRRRGR